MFRLWGCLLLTIACVSGLEFQAKISNQWLKFKSLHGKQYSGAEEKLRQTNFKKSVESILQHNLQADLGQCTYTLGVNKYSDMSDEEFKHTMLGMRLPNATLLRSVAEEFVPSVRASLPTTKDWRAENKLTPIKDQKDCGSCWTFCATGALEAHWAIQKGQLITLSEQNLLDCANDAYDNYGCDGGMPNNAFDYIIAKGIAKSECYKYEVKQSTCRFKSSCDSKVRISSYKVVPQGNENAMKEVVGNVGPLSVGIDAGQPNFKNYRSGVYNPSYCSQEPNHAVVVVGYGADNGHDYWLIKNSWGTDWGEKGYFKLARNAGNKCGVAFLPSYPII